MPGGSDLVITNTGLELGSRHLQLIFADQGLAVQVYLEELRAFGWAKQSAGRLVCLAWSAPFKNMHFSECTSRFQQSFAIV